MALTPKGRVFYSSLDGAGRPVDIRVGAGQVVPGLDEGLQTMKPGGLRRLYIPGDLSFPKGLKSAAGRYERRGKYGMARGGDQGESFPMRLFICLDDESVVVLCVVFASAFPPVSPCHVLVSSCLTYPISLFPPFPCGAAGPAFPLPLPWCLTFSSSTSPASRTRNESIDRTGTD